MKLHTLQPAAGSITKPKRIARGGARGGTSGRGHKGARSRSGYSNKRGFEGGQMPLQKRIPKFGFKSLNKTHYKPINLSLIQEFLTENKLQVLDQTALIQARIAPKNEKYKILGSGELKFRVKIHAHAFSQEAIKKIESAGGSIAIIEPAPKQQKIDSAS